jgi:hypothetical protein
VRHDDPGGGARRCLRQHRRSAGVTASPASSPASTDIRDSEGAHAAAVRVIPTGFDTDATAGGGGGGVRPSRGSGLRARLCPGCGCCSRPDVAQAARSPPTPAHCSTALTRADEGNEGGRVGNEGQPDREKDDDGLSLVKAASEGPTQHFADAEGRPCQPTISSLVGMDLRC